MIKRVQLPSGAIEYVDKNYKRPGLARLKAKQAAGFFKRSIGKIAKVLKLT